MNQVDLRNKKTRGLCHEDQKNMAIRRELSDYGKIKEEIDTYKRLKRELGLRVRPFIDVEDMEENVKSSPIMRPIETQKTRKTTKGGKTWIIKSR